MARCIIQFGADARISSDDVEKKRFVLALGLAAKKFPPHQLLYLFAKEWIYHVVYEVSLERA